jgi:hypothetical protein
MDLAHAQVRMAVHDGRLVPQPCVVCWSLPTAAHHPRGYSEEHRLDIVWLCVRCHERIHGRAISPSIGTDLRRQRTAAGIGLRELEKRTGINRGRLSIIERGVTPTDEEAAAILAALQVEVLPRQGDVA